MKLSDFPSSVSLDTGRYLLITGNRLQNGGVLTSLTYFTIHRNKMTSVPVFIRLIPEVTMPVGRINLDNLLLSVPGDGSPHNLTMLASGKKLIILLVDPDQEPSRHVLNEIRTYADHFALWDGKFVMAMPRNKSTIVSVLQPHDLPGENVQGIDINNNICKAFESLTGEKLSEKLPLVALADQDGFVYLFSAGYKIGLGEQLLKFTH